MLTISVIREAELRLRSIGRSAKVDANVAKKLRFVLGFGATEIASINYSDKRFRQYQQEQNEIPALQICNNASMFWFFSHLPKRNSRSATFKVAYPFL